MKLLHDNKIDKQILLNTLARLERSFYEQNNVLQVARELLGKILVTHFNNELTAARIVETEAYQGITDKASHAFGGRRTKRTETMYLQGGTAYVYLCYGIHNLFNVVTNIEDVPHAVLIRGGVPIFGLDIMLYRTGKLKLDTTITKGPGNLSKALGINRLHNNMNLLNSKMYIIDDSFKTASNIIATSPRIGVNYAGEDAFLPYRFYLKGNPFVSGKINK